MGSGFPGSGIGVWFLTSGIYAICPPLVAIFKASVLGWRKSLEFKFFIKKLKYSGTVGHSLPQKGATRWTEFFMKTFRQMLTNKNQFGPWPGKAKLKGCFTLTWWKIICLNQWVYTFDVIYLNLRVKFCWIITLQAKLPYNPSRISKI